MKRITTILSTLLIAVSMFAQVNFWRNGYLTRIEKEKFDSITFGYTTNYDQYAGYRYPLFAGAEPTIQNVYDAQKALYFGLEYMGYSRHSDFGYASVCLIKESFGQDFIGPNSGYNWFAYSDYNNNRVATTATTSGLANHLIWNTLYKTVIMSNCVIAANTNSYEVAQAKAMRAFAYMNLAELYQFAYGESTAFMLPCVPVVLDSVSLFKIIDMPRATVAEVYQQIQSDLDAAVEGLQGFERAKKDAVNQAVAYGLRARMNLVVHNYAQAAADAQKALQLSGAMPLSIAQAGVPGFADANAKNVIWANIIEETDDVVLTDIINWVSHLSTFYLEGYTGVGVTRRIASALYDEISSTDVRKGWWLNADRQSPLLDAAGYSEAKETILNDSYYYPAYTNVKFGTGDGSVTGDTAAAGDWILMRAEEMLLIYAEALQRQGKDGATVLADFVKTYRDPSYDINAHGLSVVDEIWWQRRVELWGEGFAFGDIMRLNKGITRTNSSNWPDEWGQQDIPASDERLPLLIPQKDEPYRALFAWNSYTNATNPYVFAINANDSITFGEAKEKTNIFFQEEGFQERMSMEQAAESHTIRIGLQRSHNNQENVTFDLEVVSASEIFGNLNTTVTFPYEYHYTDQNGNDASYMDDVVSSLYIEIPAITTPGTYSFTLRIPDEYSPYGTRVGTIRYGNDDFDGRTFTYTITVLSDQWDLITDKKAVMYDGIVSSIPFGLDVQKWYVSYARRDNSDGTFDIRLLNPYTTLPEYEVVNGVPNYDSPIADEFGLYTGFPYNYPTDVDSEGTYNMTIHVAKDGSATFDDFELGMDWNYGMFSARYYDPSIPGVWNAEEQSITFPAGSSAAFMADWGGTLTSNDIVVYLDDALWKEIHSAQETAAAPVRKTKTNIRSTLSVKPALKQKTVTPQNSKFKLNTIE